MITQVILLTLSLTSALLYPVSASTDPSDVTGLKDLYSELNYPQQLAVWSSSGGDSCEESLKGILCNGSSVIFISTNGLELSGRFGDQLFNQIHLKKMNVSSNHIYGEIPASLPPNATYIPYSKDLLTSFEEQEEGEQLFVVFHLRQLDLPNISYAKDQQQSQPEEQEEDQQQPQPDRGEDGEGGGTAGGEGGEEGGADEEGGGDEENDEEGEENDEEGGGDEENDEEGEENDEEGGGDEENDEEEGGADEENDEEAGAGQHNGAQETFSFCQPGDPRISEDTRRNKKNERTAKHFDRKSKG